MPRPLTEVRERLPRGSGTEDCGGIGAPKDYGLLRPERHASNGHRDLSRLTHFLTPYGIGVPEGHEVIDSKRVPPAQRMDADGSIGLPDKDRSPSGLALRWSMSADVALSEKSLHLRGSRVRLSLL